MAVTSALNYSSTGFRRASPLIREMRTRVGHPPTGGTFNSIRELLSVEIDILRDLFVGVELCPFSELLESYDIPPGHFLIHGALNRKIQEYWGTGIAEPLEHESLCHLFLISHWAKVGT
ncbi:hypothetical protein NDU88_001858 [Pleurodeles waltl]|uniref:Uncharacterized protein n=1 Tax=Pleurodeles waltl TaxID=8319 RepID=A0AAV7WJL4_PLEWA|nr:hypothetical protein NDU88_001858 [Pleurodeles waltl]